MEARRPRRCFCPVRQSGVAYNFITVRLCRAKNLILRRSHVGCNGSGKSFLLDRQARAARMFISKMIDFYEVPPYNQTLACKTGGFRMIPCGFGKKSI